jgi:hypothetical protein
MTPTVLILDDDTRRCDAMRGQLASSFPALSVRIFAAASEMISAMEQALPDTVLISLDHDLLPSEDRGGADGDPGTGREVADWLAGQEPVCPIIIHSTNLWAALGMEQVLRDAAWPVGRVAPYDDLTWIGEAWISEVKRQLGHNG